MLFGGFGGKKNPNKDPSGELKSSHDDEGDPYSDFDVSGQDSTPFGMIKGGGNCRPITGSNRLSTGIGMNSMNRTGTGMPVSYAAAVDGSGTSRPLTAVYGAGYGGNKPGTSVAGMSVGGGVFDPLNQSKQSRGPAPPLAEKKDNSPEDMARDLEQQVHRLLESSAEYAYGANQGRGGHINRLMTKNVRGNSKDGSSKKKDVSMALEKAKEAVKKEKTLSRHREINSLTDQANLDLTYAVNFNLAHVYALANMPTEALEVYQFIIKNKQYPHAGRLRVNMGNIYYGLRKYPSAIKMYRMALDQVPNTNKELRWKIYRNIGNAFVKLGQFQDAIQSYESVMNGNPDILTAFNLTLCFYALGDGDKMKKYFIRLLSIPIPGASIDEEEEEMNDLLMKKYSGKDKSENDSKIDDDGKLDDDLNHFNDAQMEKDSHELFQSKKKKNVNNDALKAELSKRQQEANQCIYTIARIIAPAIDTDWAIGYKWIIDTLRTDHESIASQMEIERALQYLKHSKFDKAIELFKNFERKDAHLKAMAATNLSFIYFIENDFVNCEKYSDLALKQDRYNARALVNKGNTLLLRGDCHKAKDLYLEAIGLEADCVEAIYNLGLANIKLNLLADAQQAFEKLHTIIPSCPEVVYHISNLCDLQGNFQHATKWFSILSSKVSTDPTILSRLGQLYNREQDEAQAFHYHLESYRHYPVNLDVISWLGVWYVKGELYEKAIHFFERAAQIQPKEVKWRLMITSCCRRMGAYTKAHELYQKIHHDFPDNVECLKYLVALCKDLKKPYDNYQQALSKLERNSIQVNVQGGSLNTAVKSTGEPQNLNSNNKIAVAPDKTKIYNNDVMDTNNGNLGPTNDSLHTSTPSPDEGSVVDQKEDNFDDADVSSLLV